MKLASLLAGALALAAAIAIAQPPSPERRAATEADYRATLGRLGITSIRPGADGFNRDAPNAANRDEARVGAYTLPPLLVDAAGRPVTNSGGWHHRRREIVELFDSQVYGRVPANAPAIRWEIGRASCRERV